MPPRPETPPATVERIDAWLCSIPLPAPIELAGIRLTKRDYAVVRMVDSDGVEGCAFGLARGAPVDLIVTDLLGAAVVGVPADPGEIERRAVAQLLIVGVDGVSGRARSLLDICAWDIAAKRAGEPVWRLLGDGVPGPAPALGCMLVEGYPIVGESPERFAERLGRAAETGFAALKLAAAADVDRTDVLLSHTRAAVGAQAMLAVDCTWRWRTAAAAEPAARLWARHDLAWIEDPLPAAMSAEIAALRRASPIPIACGDEVTDAGLFGELVAADAIDVVRLDATTIGGFSGFARVLERIPKLQVSPHVFPEIHRHCACAWERVGPLELFRPDSGFDVADRLVEPVAIERGSAPAPEEAGLGLRIDWSAVAAHAVRHSVAERPRVTVP